MKKLWTLIVVCFLITKTFSQPVYQSSYYASVGDSFIVSSATGTELFTYDFAQTGTNFTWNYDTLEPVTQRTQRFVDPDTSGYYPTFWLDCYLNCLDTCSGFNCLACGTVCTDEWNNIYNLAEATNDSLNLGIIVLKNLYNFYNKNSNSVSQISFGATVYGIPLIFPYEIPDTLYDFPMQYGNQDAHYSKYEIDLTSLGIPLTYKHSQTRSNEVEGWGTLKTPYGTMDSMLKVKTIIYNMDTVIWAGDTLTLSTLLPEELVPDSTIEFKWFRKKFGVPLLTVSGMIISGDTIFAAANYIDSFRCFTPSAIFGYLPAPVSYLNAANDSVQVSFYSLVLNTDSVHWNFNDAASLADSVSELPNPTHWFTADGTYWISLTACNKKCTPTVCDTIILPLEVIDTTKVFADFTANPRYPCFGDTVQFINKSIRDTTAFWDFDDGFTSTLDSPKHLFSAAGIYDVMLIASNSFGSDTAFMEIKVANLINANYTFNDSLTNVPVQFTNTSTGTDTATTYLWTFTGGSPSITSSSDENPIVTFNKPGIAEVCLSVYNNLGCKEVICKTITIYECVTAKFSTGLFNPTAFCAGDPITLTNQTTIGGGMPVPTYEWQLDGVTFATTTNATKTINTRGDYVLSLIATNAVCTDTAKKNISINEPATVDAGSDTSICEGDSVQLNPAFDNGGQISYTLSWTPTTSLSNPNILNPIAKPTVTTTYTLSANFFFGTCNFFVVIKDSLTVNVNAAVTPSVSIVASDDTVCAGTSVTFTTDTVQNQGISPNYDWYLNGIIVQSSSSNTFSNSSLANGDTIFCQMTSTANCASPNPVTSNLIIIGVVNPVTPSVTISASDDTICGGDNVTFTATPTNGGSSPGYQWKINGINVGPVSSTFSTISLLDGDIVTCAMTSALGCVTKSTDTSNAIIMTVNPTPNVIVTIAATPSDKICDGDSVTFIATPINGGSSPTYQWKLNGSNVGTNSDKYGNNNLADGDDITCIMTSNANCANNPDTSNTITMTVNALPNPVITQSGNTLSVTNTFSSYQWYEISDSDFVGVDSNYIAFVSGDYFVWVTDSNGCSGKSNVLTVLVGISELQIADYKLQIAPNPFSEQTEIRYSLATDAQIKIELYNLLGQKIKTIADEKQGGGEHHQVLEMEKNNGIYFLKVSVDEKTQVKKIVQIQ